MRAILRFLARFFSQEPVYVQDGDGFGGSAACVTPDLGRHEQEAEPRGRQRRVPQFGGISLRLAVEQHQPAIQVVRQHGQLEVIAVHVKPAGRMRRQPGIAVRLSDSGFRRRRAGRKTRPRNRSDRPCRSRRLGTGSISSGGLPGVCRPWPKEISPNGRAGGRCRSRGMPILRTGADVPVSNKICCM